MKILIVSDGFAHFDTTISVYIDRLRGDIEVVTVKSEKSKDPVVIVRKETERVIQYLQKMTKPYVILLDEHANMYTTPEFLTLSDAARETSREVVYVVGGAYGLDRDMIWSWITQSLALSPMVLPHSLALLVLLEQLYRIREIRRGSKYHHS